jgi:diacylglycerol kinase family enzyme
MDGELIPLEHEVDLRIHKGALKVLIPGEGQAAA